MMHDHALHKLHIRQRARPQRAPRRRRQRPARLSRRARLYHNWLRRIPLLRPRARAEETTEAEEACSNARSEHHAPQHRRSFCRAGLPLEAKAIKLPPRCVGVTRDRTKYHLRVFTDAVPSAFILDQILIL